MPAKQPGARKSTASKRKKKPAIARKKETALTPKQAKFADAYIANGETRARRL
jgi:hypothetical protein